MEHSPLMVGIAIPSLRCWSAKNISHASSSSTNDSPVVEEVLSEVAANESARDEVRSVDLANGGGVKQSAVEVADVDASVTDVDKAKLNGPPGNPGKKGQLKSHAEAARLPFASHKQGQSPCYDNLCRPVTDLLPLIESGVKGVTSNPAMDTKYKLIPEISVTEKDKNWTAKVIVSEKTSARTSQNGSIRYQNLILMDPQKNKIQATLFDNHITAFEDLLLLSKTYLISNATIKLTKPEYVASVGPIHWVITGKTRVIEIQEDNNALLSSTYNFTPFDKLKEYMDVDADISIIGVAIDIKPKRLIKVRSGISWIASTLVRP
ncbi:Nucleic acid-binding [Abeliophyllum distichum]|uniref:Nucleic acid-binding n=1 Tax=Abeliophyllum distichum TaxID=126358 RepID=A0ABD1NXQ6_9LAMI